MLAALLPYHLASAAPPFQMTPFPTPTPGPDGRILYTVQANDTLLRISLISGVSIDEIRGLNNLAGDNISVGQVLLLGLGGPVISTPSPGPSPTATDVIPTPTKELGTGMICVLLYNDENGNSIRETSELSIPGGAINLNNNLGSVSLTSETVESEDPQCYEDLAEGDYTISVAVPAGFNATTETTYILSLNAGDETYLDFGAQRNSTNDTQSPIPTDDSGKSPLLGIIGGFLLVAGLGLGVFATRMMRAK
ncbi:MAG: LysM peptidoglycan-binding domain-containing protein [Anaerolineales bacterium]|nr:LysM peptidoglycan-binding domain-containing protein [Anaerolineales bacterium]